MSDGQVRSAGRGGTQGPLVTAIVLAGGGSRRFGSDKLVAPVGGMPLLHRAVLGVVAVADELVIVIAPEAPEPSLPDGIAVPVRFVRDPEPDKGPLVGVLAGLEAAESDLAIVVAGDMPLLVPVVLRRCLDVVGGGGDDAVVLEDPSGLLRPFPMALHVAAARLAAAAAVAAGERRLGRLLERLGAQTLSANEWRALDPDGTTLWDVDRPEDAARLADRLA
jgi:molybdenum cofactor guanylyltransferase